MLSSITQQLVKNIFSRLFVSRAILLSSLNFKRPSSLPQSLYSNKTIFESVLCILRKCNHEDFLASLIVLFVSTSTTWLQHFKYFKNWILNSELHNDESKFVICSNDNQVFKISKDINLPKQTEVVLNIFLSFVFFNVEIKMDNLSVFTQG
jgi:hypothetical protein